MPREANTIYISPFPNRTPRMELPEKLMSNLRQAIASDGRLAVVESGDSADIILQGAINQCQVQALSFNKFGKAEKKTFAY